MAKEGTLLMEMVAMKENIRISLREVKFCISLVAFSCKQRILACFELHDILWKRNLLLSIMTNKDNNRLALEGESHQSYKPDD